MFFDNFDLIKKWVLEFKDSEGNIILYFLMILVFFDEFVVFVMENIINDGMYVYLKNKFSIILLMFVVE